MKNLKARRKKPFVKKKPFTKMSPPFNGCSYEGGGWDGVAWKKVYVVSWNDDHPVERHVDDQIYILVNPDLDVCLSRGFSEPFYGECWESGDTLHFHNPGAVTVEFDRIFHFDPYLY